MNFPKFLFHYSPLLLVFFLLGLGCSNSSQVAEDPNEQDVSWTPYPGADGVEFPLLDGGGTTAPGQCDTPGALGCPCEGASDCDSGLCILTPNGTQCSDICTGECPDGWLCTKLDENCPDCPTVCVSSVLYLCRPCFSDEDCINPYSPGGEKCLDFGAQGRYCGVSCVDGSQCPLGYNCEAANPVFGASTKQCVPMDGICSCSLLSTADVATTTCENTNAHGTCTGEKFCGESGMTVCSAQTPIQEICDGLDNNCNGQTDDNACPAGQSCECQNGPCQCACPLNTPDCLEGTDCTEGEKTPCNTQCGVGFQPCTQGSWGPCEGPEPINCLDYTGCTTIQACVEQCPEAPQEICNGADDDCDGSPDDEFACIQGEIQNEQCPGSCGYRSRTCGEDCVWGAWGACSGADCIPGTTDPEEVSCGACGTQTVQSTCDENCNWSAPEPITECINAGECTPGEKDECSGCTERTCTGSCLWSECQLKEGKECDHLSESGIAGGNWQCCGTGMWQFCSSECMWYPCANCAGAPNHCENNCP